MHGEAGEARDLLERALAEDPENAAAQYELARTMVHMGLADPRKLMGDLDAVQGSIDRAVEEEPGNLAFRAFAGQVAFLEAYVAMETGTPDAKDKVARMIDAFESILEVDPDYHPAELCLVEIHTNVPEELGGDRSEAERRAKRLEETDPLCGAKARSLLLGEGDMVAYWKGVEEKLGGSADVLAELGCAYLYREQPDSAELCFTRAVKLDPDRAVLFLDVTRSCGMMALQQSPPDPGLLDEAISAEDRFLASDAPAPLRAYTLGLLARIEQGRGNPARAESLFARAGEADPFYSRAFGIPSAELFLPPGAVPEGHHYMFRPY